MKGVLLTLVALAAFCGNQRAYADGDDVEIAPINGGLSVDVSHVYPGSPSGGGQGPAQASGHPGVLIVDVGVDLEEEFCAGINWTVGCVPESGADLEDVLNPGLVARAFRRLQLPASELVVQPPGGRTLVNFETNFYTENGEFTRTVDLLGQRVELRIWPSVYGWRFGDGAVRQTVGAGSPFPDLEITHRYLDKGRVSPRVDTTYAAQFRVNGGPWRDVAGTVTVPGAAEGLRVVEARPVLVGY
jgi:hypothetical protein